MVLCQKWVSFWSSRFQNDTHFWNGAMWPPYKKGVWWSSCFLKEICIKCKWAKLWWESVGPNGVGSRHKVCVDLGRQEAITGCGDGRPLISWAALWPAWPVLGLLGSSLSEALYVPLNNMPGHLTATSVRAWIDVIKQGDNVHPSLNDYHVTVISRLHYSHKLRTSWISYWILHFILSWLLSLNLSWLVINIIWSE